MLFTFCFWALTTFLTWQRFDTSPTQVIVWHYLRWLNKVCEFAQVYIGGSGRVCKAPDLLHNEVPLMAPCVSCYIYEWSYLRGPLGYSLCFEMPQAASQPASQSDSPLSTRASVLASRLPGCLLISPSGSLLPSVFYSAFVS